MEMFYNMIKPSENEGDSDDEGVQDHDHGNKIIEKHKIDKFKQTKLSEKGQKIRNKIKFISKMLKMQKTLR